MKKYRIVFVTVLFLNLFSKTLYAQTALKDSAIFSILKNAQQTLTSKSNYRYGILYRYSNESKPLITIDSLSGYIASDKGSYHLKFGSTEMISNDRVSLSLFNDDHIIYLTKAVTDSVLNPSMPFDRLIEVFPNIEGSVVTTKKDSILKVYFPGNDLYKLISFYIDRKSHLISRVVYITKTETLVKSGMFDREGNNIYDEYAQVETIFTDFQEGVNTENEFNESNYLKKENNVYAGVGNYSGYKIIIGSPGL